MAADHTDQPDNLGVLHQVSHVSHVHASSVSGPTNELNSASFVVSCVSTERAMPTFAARPHQAWQASTKKRKSMELIRALARSTSWGNVRHHVFVTFRANATLLGLGTQNREVVRVWVTCRELPETKDCEDRAVGSNICTTFCGLPWR